MGPLAAEGLIYPHMSSRALEANPLSCMVSLNHPIDSATVPERRSSGETSSAK
jgi:hypothetical protein